MKPLILLGTIAIALAGCSTPALEFVPANVSRAQNRLDAALISTVVSVAPRSERTGSVNIAGSEADVTSLWKSALEDSLLRAAAFRDDSSRRLSLSVKILKLEMGGALGFSVESVARYQLIDRNTGEIAYTADIEAIGQASDYVGTNRVRKAASRSVQANIVAFLQRLETANLTSSTTPAGN